MSRFERFLYPKVRFKLGLSINEKNRATLFIMLMIFSVWNRSPTSPSHQHIPFPTSVSNIDIAECKNFVGNEKTCRVGFKEILEHLSQKSLIWISNSVPFMTDSKFKAFCYFKRWYRDTSVLLDVQINEEFRIFSKILLLRFNNAEVFV